MAEINVSFGVGDHEIQRRDNGGSDGGEPCDNVRASSVVMLCASRSGRGVGGRLVKYDF